MDTRRLTRDAMLAGVALIVFVFEAQLPPLTSVPGIKMGLANIVTLYAMFALEPRDAAGILLCRVLLGAVIVGNLSTLMYSAAGGAACFLVMLLLRRILTQRQMWAASVAGAIAHNAAQVAVAVAVTRTPALAAQLPILMVSGVIAGLFTGLCAQVFTDRMSRRPKQ